MGPCVPECAGCAKRLRFDTEDNFEWWWIAFNRLGDMMGKMSQAKHHTTHPVGREPFEQIVGIGTAFDRREELRKVAEHRSDSGSKSAGKDGDVNLG